jgi:hypothetical protein
MRKPIPANSPTPASTKTVQTLSGWLLAVSGLVACLGELTGTINKVIQIPPAASWGIAGFLMVVGAALLVPRRPRSKLLRPQALQLNPDRRDHLLGRDKDIKELCEVCAANSLVLMDGESGAGKTALVHAGLCPYLREANRLLPIYVKDLSGPDWVENPKRALTDAIRNALTEEENHRVGKELSDRNPFPFLEAVEKGLGLKPLLVFDQFDDYQTQHEQLFKPNGRPNWLTPAELVEANPYWKRIKKMLDEKAVHCLFVVRNDAALGLTSMHLLTSPGSFSVARLYPAVVGELLSKLTEPPAKELPVVSHPESDWEQLKARMESDLSEGGTATVLAAQMKVALLGLRNLKALTVRDYLGKGGLKGLEAAYVQLSVDKVARQVRLQPAQVITLLTSLVDREAYKSVPQSADDLHKLLEAAKESGTGLPKETVNKALGRLKGDDLLRELPGQATWVLDHDYLCHAVLELERRTSKWSMRLKEADRAFQATSGNLWQKFQALLGPRQQLRLAFARLRGQFRYGEHRAYALYSLIRLVPWLLAASVLLLVWFQWDAQHQKDKDSKDARNILDDIALSNELSPAELVSFWELAGSSSGVQTSFLEQGLDRDGRATRLGRRADIAAHCLVGLSPDRKKKFQEQLLPYLWALPDTPSANGYSAVDLARVKLGIAVAIQEKLTPAEALKLASPLIKEIQSTTDPHQLSFLGAGLRAVASKLNDAGTQKVFKQIAEAITNRLLPLPEQLNALAEGLKGLRGEITREGGEPVLDPILKAIATSTDSRQLREGLKEALRAVAQRLSVDDTTGAIAQVLSRIEREDNLDRLDALAGGLASLAGNSAPPEIVGARTQQILQAITTMSLPSRFSALVNALEALQGELPAKEGITALNKVVERLQQTHSSDELLLLTPVLLVVAKKMPRKEGKSASQTLLTVMGKADHPGHLLSLAEALQVVQIDLLDLSSPEVSMALERTLKLVGERTDPDGRLPLAKALKALAGKLNPKGASKPSASICKALQEESSPEHILAWAEALHAVPGEPDPTKALEALTSLLGAIRRANGLDDLRRLGAALKAVAEKLPSAAAKDSSHRIREAIRGTVNPHHLPALAEGLSAVRSPIDPGGDQEVFSRIEGLLPKARSADDLLSLTKALKAVVKPTRGAALTATAQKVRERILDRIGVMVSITSSPVEVRSLAEALRDVPGNPPGPQANSVLQHVLTVIDGTTDPTRLREFAEVLQVLPPGALEEQRLLELLKWPVCIGEFRAQILLVLEQQTNQQFQNDLWKAVAWAQSAKLDVSRVPRRPKPQQPEG